MTTSELRAVLFVIFLSEEWKSIPDHPGYEMSNWGRLRHCWIRTGPYTMAMGGEWTFCKQFIHERTGHIYYHLSKMVGGSNLRASAARLVLMAFDRRPEHGEEARHVHDPTPTNNFRWNLAWGTASQNTIDKVLHGNHKLAKLNPDLIRRIRTDLRAGMKQADVADRYGVTRTNVCMINTGKTWAHIS